MPILDGLNVGKKIMSPIIDELVALIAAHGWQPRFGAAIKQAKAYGVQSLSHITTLDDYLRFIDEMVRWAPRESGDSTLVHDKLVEFYFILDQPPLRELQSAVEPSSVANGLTPLSKWIADYAGAWGDYLDTAESAVHVESFQSDPAFRWHDYMPPPSGYRTFNQFFARHVKPGYRPVADSDDPSVIVSPADAVFLGGWRVTPESEITVKGMRWAIADLLKGSPFADRFANGLFTHCALRTFDYHRWHAPLAGRVVDARLIRGQAYLDVKVEGAGSSTRLEAVEGTGYQFVQMRGLVVLQTSHGLVACLPVGMAQVSSVVITAEIGRRLQKGEEMGYFQFGGSDFVMVFEDRCKAQLECQKGAHYFQGSAIGGVG